MVVNATVTAHWDGEATKKALRQFETQKLGAGFKREMRQRVTEWMRVSTAKKLNTNGGSASWPELEASTILWKQREGFGSNANKPLQRTGQLGRWLTSFSVASAFDDGDEAVIMWPGPLRPAIHKRLEAAQHGAEPDWNGAKRTPARPLVFLENEDSIAMMSMVRDWLNSDVS